MPTANATGCRITTFFSLSLFDFQHKTLFGLNFFLEPPAGKSLDRMTSGKVAAEEEKEEAEETKKKTKQMEENGGKRKKNYNRNRLSHRKIKQT